MSRNIRFDDKVLQILFSIRTVMFLQSLIILIIVVQVLILWQCDVKVKAKVSGGKEGWVREAIVQLNDVTGFGICYIAVGRFFFY